MPRQCGCTRGWGSAAPHPAPSGPARGATLGRFTHVVVRRYQEVWTREVDGVRPPAAGSNEIATEKITTTAMVKAI
jgi:hypothetical protein